MRAIVRLGLVGLLAYATGPALAESTGDPVPATSQAPPPAPAPLAPADPDDASLDARRDGIALEWHGATFWSRRPSHYTFHSASIGYVMSTGSPGPFLHITGQIPFAAAQDGTAYGFRQVYEQGFGLDVMTGAQWRWRLERRLEVEAGPGVHVDYMTYTGRDNFVSFSALQLGVGGESVLRWRPGWRLGRRWWSFGATGVVTIDFYDPLRSNDLRNGFTFRAGLVAGVDGD